MSDYVLWERIALDILMKPNGFIWALDLCVFILGRFAEGSGRMPLVMSIS